MERRGFLVRTGLILGASGLAANCSSKSARRRAAPGAPADWKWFREQFALARDAVHAAGFLLASHPEPVRAAIEKHRHGLDENPIDYIFANGRQLELAVLRTASDYLGVRPVDIALTDSTTMGLGLLYGSIALLPDQEILTTTHDHYATAESLRYRAERTGAKLRRVPLYADPSRATAEEIVTALVGAVTPKTRVVAITWVHSGTGVKLPIRQIADALARLNEGRAEADRALLCVDGVHGLGNQDMQVGELGCDFFVAGTHKWLFGPRGTGLVWGTEAAWKAAHPTIPTFALEALQMWEKDAPAGEIPMARLMTPGGYHSFEHRWALADAFLFNQQVGRAQISERVRQLNQQAREGLGSLPKVTLHTPMAEELSGGITCFEVDGLRPRDVVKRLEEKRIFASVSVTPYETRYVRVAFSAFNAPEDVETTVGAIREIT
jgi:isopenicillin-N epimerase